MNAQIAYQGETFVIPAWTFADKLRKCRTIASMDQRTFAEHIGVKPSAYAQWEADNNKPRDIVTVAKSVEMLTRVPATWILGIDDRPTEGSGSNRPQSDYKSAGSPVVFLEDRRARAVGGMP